MKSLKHWQDAVNAVLGIWLGLSPWALHFSSSRIPTDNALVVGVLLVAVALGAMFIPRAWEEWTEFALGIWLLVSPWILGYTGLSNARLVAVATGLAIALLALWTVASDKSYRHLLGDHASR